MGRLELEMLPNTRDLGGMMTGDGRVIKYNMLIRSGALFGLSERDLYELEKHRLSLVVDFRTNFERNSRPDPVIEGVENSHLMIFDEKKLGITREADSISEMVFGEYDKDGIDNAQLMQYISNLYIEMMRSEFVRLQFSKFIDLVISNSSRGATLWHCSAGKDRAGIATVHILECLGVDRDTIIDDYLITNTYCKDEIDRGVRYVMSKTGSRDRADMAFSLLGARKMYIDDFYYEIELEYGTFEKYLNDALGIDKNKLSLMRDIFLKEK